MNFQLFLVCEADMCYGNVGVSDGVEEEVFIDEINFV